MRVYDLSLRDFSISHIARAVKISISRVSIIFDTFKAEDRIYYLLRALADNLRKAEIDLQDYAQRIRMKNVREKFGGTQEELRKIIYSPSGIYYRAHFTAKDLVSNMKKILEFCDQYGENPTKWMDLNIENFLEITKIDVVDKIIGLIRGPSEYRSVFFEVVKILDRRVKFPKKLPN